MPIFSEESDNALISEAARAGEVPGNPTHRRPSLPATCKLDAIFVPQAWNFPKMNRSGKMTGPEMSL